MKDNNIGVVSASVFIIIITIGLVYSSRPAAGVFKGCVRQWQNKEISLTSIPESFESGYDSIFSSNELSLDVFSLTQRFLRKHEARNFEVLKANNGQLYLQDNGFPSDKITQGIISGEYQQIYNETVRNGGKFLYVQEPYKNAAQTSELKNYSNDQTEEIETIILNNLKKNGVPTLDLRNYPECEQYYKTDHHWTVQSAFNASAIIIDNLKNKQGMEFLNSDVYGNISNYKAVTYKNCFLGSIGIKVGKYFTGKDDFTAYRPLFNTNLKFKHYINGNLQLNRSGQLWDVFINQGLLKNKTYNNKYDANMYGAYVESIIKNYKAKNNYKGLLITNSYGRSMAEYMCLNFHELRYLDPQVGRYNGNYLDYIKKYKPDVVILMYDFLINVGDGNWTN